MAPFPMAILARFGLGLETQGPGPAHHPRGQGAFSNLGGGPSQFQPTHCHSGPHQALHALV